MPSGVDAADRLRPKLALLRGFPQVCSYWSLPFKVGRLLGFDPDRVDVSINERQAEADARKTASDKQTVPESAGSRPPSCADHKPGRVFDLDVLD